MGTLGKFCRRKGQPNTRRGWRAAWAAGLTLGSAGAWAQDASPSALPAWGLSLLAAVLLGAWLGAWLTRRRARGLPPAEAHETAHASRAATLEAACAQLEDQLAACRREHAAIAAAARSAENAQRARTSFLLGVSHEMRTPLNAILGLTHLAQCEETTGMQHQRLGQVSAAAQQLLRLINEALERSRREGSHGGERTAARPATPVPPGAPLPRFAGERVLLAEDEAVNQLVAVGILEKAGLVVDVAHNGAEAVHLASSRPYALVLMDLQMPGLDGLAATRALRASSSAHAGAGLPIVALSAFAFDEDRRRCLEAGMNEHLSKPVDPAALLHTVRHWLRASQP